MIRTRGESTIGLELAQLQGPRSNFEVGGHISDSILRGGGGGGGAQDSYFFLTL